MQMESNMNTKRTWIGTIVAVIVGAALTSSVAHADVWSPLCTPDLIHMYPDRLAVRCLENSTKWYWVFYADHPNGHVDRVLRALHAVQLSGRQVQFHDIGDLGNANNRKFDTMALPK
jgi:hypothetical protein